MEEAPVRRVYPRDVLVGVELAGFLGAMFALPVAGIIQVIVQDLMEHRGEASLVALNPRPSRSETRLGESP
jgi:predicted PurR-regulated permease PerM